MQQKDRNSTSNYFKFIRLEILNRYMLYCSQFNKSIDTNKYVSIIQNFWQEFRSLLQNFIKHETTCCLFPQHAYVCKHFCLEIVTVKKPHRNWLHDQRLDSCLNVVFSQISPDINLTVNKNGANFVTPVYSSWTVERTIAKERTIWK
jgi:hypothetical protein